MTAAPSEALLHLAQQQAQEGLNDVALATLDRLLDAVLPTAPDAPDWSPLRRLRARALIQRARIHFEMDHYDEAIRHFSSALPLLDPAMDAPLRQTALGLLSFSALSLRLYAPAMQWAQAALDLALRHDDLLMRSRAMLALGCTAAHLGDGARAEHFMQAGLACALEHGDANVTEAALTNLVFTACAVHDQCMEEGRSEAAAQALARAEPLLQQRDALELPPMHPLVELSWRNNRSAWLLRRGEYDEAHAGFAAVYPPAHQRGWVDLARFAAYGLGRVALQRGQPERAQHWLAQCVSESDAYDSYDIIGRAQRELAILADASGDSAAARQYRRKASERALQLESQRRRVTDVLLHMDWQARAAMEGQ